MFVDDAALWMIVVRLVLPFTILRFPLLGTLLNAYVDVIDYRFIGGYEWYQSVDKLLDVYYLSFSAYMVVQWRDLWARWVALVAYGWRLVGVLMFLAVEQQWVMVIFPNLFEPFFVFYLLFAYITSGLKRPKEMWKSLLQRQKLPLAPLRATKWEIVLIVTALLLPKLVQEYVLHIFLPARHLAPEWVGTLLAYASQHSWVSPILYMIPPVVVLVWLLWKQRAKSPV